MPIYEYECDACKIRFERFQSVHDTPVKTCPECGGATRRVFHPVGIIFKGSGFYVTDNRKPSTPASSPSKSEDGNGKSDKEAPAATAKSDSSDGGAKAATKSEAS